MNVDDGSANAVLPLQDKDFLHERNPVAAVMKASNLLPIIIGPFLDLHLLKQAALSAQLIRIVFDA